jgi:hypothetical protein
MQTNRKKDRQTDRQTSNNNNKSAAAGSDAFVQNEEVFCVYIYAAEEKKKRVTCCEGLSFIVKNMIKITFLLCEMLLCPRPLHIVLVVAAAHKTILHPLQQ